MSDTAIRYGATDMDWDTFSLLLDLTADLLPVVSNPNLPISPDSKMKGIGKTPSVINRDGFIAGLPSWTERVATDFDIKRWKACRDYGICIQTRLVRGIDVDIKDKALAEKVRLFIRQRYKFPVRFRRDSNKFLMAVRVVGEIPKSVLYLTPRETRVKGDPQIEFLGNGQQFVACGTHPDGARYEWDWQGLDDFPEITIAQYTELREALAQEFAVEQTVMAGGLRKAKVSGAAVVDDPVASFLFDHDHVLDEGRNGELFIECPWKDGHSSDSGDTETAYFPKGGRGYQQGHFKCLHASCGARSDGDFLEAFGYHDDLFEALPPEPVVKGKTVALPLPAFKTDDQGRIKVTLHNAKLALARPDLARMNIRLDEFRDEVMWTTEDQPSGWRPFTDADQVRLRQFLGLNGFKDEVPKEMMRDAVLEHADRYRFDSAIEWLTKEVPAWDGKRRIETFLTTHLKVEDTPYTRAVARYLWTALAGRTLEPGVKADMVPILVGEQGARKSSAIAALVPSEEFFVEIDLSDDDDNLARVQRAKMVAEIPELKGLHTRDLESIKAFVAKRFETWVPKYREFAVKYPRRLVFVGSTNEKEFLADGTGNRRWLPVTVGLIEVDAIVRDRLQLWAEARDLFLECGVDWSAEKLAEEAHKKHSMNDPWEEVIERYLDTPQMVGDEEKTTPRELGFVVLVDVAREALGIETKNLQNFTTKRLGAIFRKLGMEKTTKRVDGKPVCVFAWRKV